MISKRAGAWTLVSITLGCAVAFLLSPRIPQPQAYHDFADHRARLGITNFNDVVSNLPFAIVGIWGWAFLASKSSRAQFIQHRERWPYFLIFLGLLWTAFGSAYYHLAPDNARLVWDRLPMTIVFMPLVAAMIMERLDVAWGLRLLPIFMAIGIVSVIQWRISELRGVGDLRFYAAVQLYSVFAVLALLFVYPRYTRNSDFAWILLCYVLAKVFETADRTIFRLDGGFVGGHTLKHLAAGIAGYLILRMLQKRRPYVELASSS
jgi:hypothetical protein